MYVNIWIWLSLPVFCIVSPPVDKGTHVVTLYTIDFIESPNNYFFDTNPLAYNVYFDHH